MSDQQQNGGTATLKDDIVVGPPQSVPPLLIAALVIITYLVLAADVPPATFDDEQIVDFLIRNQRALFGVAGLFVGGLVLWVAYSRGNFEVAARQSRARADASWVTPFLVPVMRPFTWAAVISLVIFLVFTALKPIPPDAWLGLPPPLRDRPENAKLILFIHGWNGDAISTWRDFPELVLADPQQVAYNVWSVDYPTFMARRNLTVTELAEFLAYEFIDVHALFDRYSDVFVVAHSMGGLVTRDAAILMYLQGRPRSFAKLIEISVPHDGADPAGLASTLWISRALTANMSSGSDFLKGLQTRWRGFAAKPMTFCIGSPQDAVVFDGERPCGV